MSRHSGLASFGLSFLIVASTALFSATVGASTSDNDGRYIYVRTTWAHMSVEQQKQVIDIGVQLLQNEIKQDMSQTPVLKTLTNTVFAPDKMQALSDKLKSVVTVVNNSSWRNTLPAAIMFYGGGSAGMGWIGSGKGSFDVGVVMLVQAVTEIDTVTNARRDYYHFDWDLVGFPHGYVGLGIGEGGSMSAGVGLIWGNLDRASDFSGVYTNIAADAHLVFGADLSGGMVFKANGTKFGVGVAEIDWGPEASISVDGELGAIMPLSDLTHPFAPAPAVEHTADIPAPSSK